MRPQEDTDRVALRALFGAAVAGLAAIAVYSLDALSVAEFFSLVGVGLLIAGTSLFVAGVLGFLFGIPRTLQQGGASTDSSDASTDYRANTNLEQISDWLTKMLVGVGLTQLMTLPAHMESLSEFLAEGFGARPTDAVFALSIILYFSPVGFLFGFLWTRLFLAGAMRQADLGDLYTRVEQTDQKLEAFKTQSVLDVDALNLISRQLNPGGDDSQITQKQLTLAVKEASHEIRIQIFNQAKAVRSENWRDNVPQMERTIPIFRALIDCDSAGRYHKNHGQLGFALKDQREPDFVEADQELSTAIQMRDSREFGGWRFYEFNRAICRIRMDEQFEQGKPSEQERRNQIIGDLSATWQSDLRLMAQEDDLISQWRKLNKVRITELRPQD